MSVWNKIVTDMQGLKKITSQVSFPKDFGGLFFFFLSQNERINQDKKWTCDPRTWSLEKSGGKFHLESNLCRMEEEGRRF